MEELKCKKASRKAYRSHLTCLFRKVGAILESKIRPTETQKATLTSSIGQLTEWGTLLHEFDTQITATIETENELEAEIIEAKATQEAILDKISQIKQRIDSLHTSPATHPLSVSTTEFSVPSEPMHRREQPVSRLPKLNLPSFTDDPLTWLDFWDSFEAAVNLNWIKCSTGWCPEVQLPQGSATWRCFTGNSWIATYECKLQSCCITPTRMVWSVSTK